jgi:putative ABC transport system ATP-binding protein
MLKISGLTKSFGAGGERQVLKDIDFELAAGEYVAIVGESGIGKSTLLNLIAGLDTPDAGSIAIGGTDITRLDERARTLLRRRRVGFVFQAFHLLPHLNVAQNIALTLSLNGIAPGEAGRRTHAMLERLKLESRAGDLPRTLSAGEMQRVAIGRALVHRPQLLLADEPTGNLDPQNAARVLDFLREEIRQSGACGILVTHSRTAAKSAQRTLELTAAGLNASAAP